MLRLLSLFAATMMAFTVSAAAEENSCSPRLDALAQLEGKYTEQPVALGLSENGRIIEVLSSQDGATWTIMMTLPNGISCYLASGEGWASLPHSVALGSGI